MRLVSNTDQEANMRKLLTEISYLNSVIQSSNPKEDHNMAEFHQRGINFQLFLQEEMPWLSWPTYLHIGICHTGEILQSKESIAKFSAQAKEGKNKLVKSFKVTAMYCLSLS